MRLEEISSTGTSAFPNFNQPACDRWSSRSKKFPVEKSESLESAGYTAIRIRVNPRPTEPQSLS
jgi:hypothetical protein